MRVLNSNLKRGAEGLYGTVDVGIGGEVVASVECNKFTDLINLNTSSFNEIDEIVDKQDEIEQLVNQYLFSIELREGV